MLRFLLFLSGAAVAAPQLDPLLGGNSPQVSLDYATFKGTTAIPGADSFLGMPFAKAGRYENPRVVNSKQDKLSGVQDATKYGPACPQQELIASPLSNQNAEVGSILSAVEQLAFVGTGLAQQSEDCLSVNVQIPKGMNMSSAAKLPVIFWIHGGGFELGASSALGSETTALPGLIYQGANIVSRSVEMNQPVIFVSANHRLNAFGGLASQEITDAGVANLHLKDQRTAMRWIQKYISQFGGDPTKVTLFGESAGSMSIATHLVLNDGNPEGLFRGAIMASGGALKVKDYKQEQPTFDFFARCTGCDSSGDKLDCLRRADFNKLYNCLQQIPNFFSYTSTKVPWYPRPDGTFLKKSPHTLIREGKIANVPYIIGDMKDEGTLFSLVSQLNITSDADFRSFWKDIFFQDLSDEQIQAFTDLYSQNPAEGSPFDTGVMNAIGPQYKRLAAAVGDYTFQAGRRDLLNYTYALRGRSQRTYTYLQEQSIPLLGRLAPPPLNTLTGLPVLGSFHVSDVALNSFGTIPPAISRNTRDLMSTYIAFVNSLDPNTHGLGDLPEWPTWTPEGRGMFKYQESGARVIRDDYREKQFDFVNGRADTYVF